MLHLEVKSFCVQQKKIEISLLGIHFTENNYTGRKTEKSSTFLKKWNKIYTFSDSTADAFTKELSK